MIKVEQIQNFNGFGTGKQAGEYFHSQGMNKSQFGIAPKLSITDVADNSGLANLQLVNWYSQGMLDVPYVYAFASDGRLYRATMPAVSWNEQRAVDSVSVHSHGNGLIFDQINRLLYANDEFLGMSSDGVSFTDNWKDFGASTTGFRAMDTYEDWVVIGNINKIALLNVTDDSFNSEGLTLPSGFNVRCFRSGINGVLIGVNFNNRGALILWDPNQLRSLAPWIWRNKNIQAIIPKDSGWVVITQDEIFFTNGYSVQPLLSDFPDYILNDLSILNGILPQGADIRGNNLLFWGNNGRFNRQKAGLYLYNFKVNNYDPTTVTSLFEFIPVSNGVTFGLTTGAIYSDTNNFVHLSYETLLPNAKFIGRIDNGSATQAFIITEQLGQGDNEKVVGGVKLTLGVSSNQTMTPDLTFNVSVKVANGRRNLFGWGLTRATSTSANILKIDGSLSAANGINKAQQGDEVTILEGANAGQIRHIISIANQGTNTEEWTLDSVLPNETESTVHLNISPFKLAHKYSLSGLTELVELFFNMQTSLKGKKFFVKVVFENLPNGFMPELKSGQFIYEELALKR